MDEFWQAAKDTGGVCGAADGELGSDRLTDIRNDYRWTPQCQRAFLEALVCTASISRACREVEKSPRSAYDLRFRRQGAAFSLGWDAAILIARAMLADTLLDRAVCGYEEMTTKQDDGTVVRGKFDNRLSLGLLDRLDKMAEKQALSRSHDAQVQLVVQDFEAFLELIEKGGTGADAALFCAARSVDGGELIDPAEKRAIACELARISAAEAEAQAEEQAIPDMLDEEPEVAAQRLSVWYCGITNEWRTNFPPSEDADEDELEQEGLFGDPDYERKLSPDEEEAHIAAIARDRAPWRDAAAAARDAWFGMRGAA
jgi:hypothetical protein